MPTDRDDAEEKRKLVELVQEAVRCDDALREKYQVGERFRFVRDRLHALLDQLEKHAEAAAKVQEDKSFMLSAAEDEVLVYVYLYNAQGIDLQTWLNMLTPKLFREYSVNRPLYLERPHIESLIRSRTNKAQHAFLTVAVKKTDLIHKEDVPKDALGNPVVKIRDGALCFDKFISFTHNEQDYVLNIREDHRTLVKRDVAKP